MVAFLKNYKQHKDVVELSLSNSSQLSWENDHEFSYNGEMYDLLDKKMINGKAIIRCISDDKETVLVKDYQKTNHNRSNETIIQLFTASFILPGNFSISKPETVIDKSSFYRTQSLPQISSSVFIPPPEVC